MQVLRLNTAQMYQQVINLGILLDQFRAYADHIGCTLQEDEVICPTPGQAKQLARWWLLHNQNGWAHDDRSPKTLAS